MPEAGRWVADPVEMCSSMTRAGAAAMQRTTPASLQLHLSFTSASRGRQNVPRKRISDPGDAASTSARSGNSRRAPQVAMVSSRQLRTASRL